MAPHPDIKAIMSSNDSSAPVDNQMGNKRIRSMPYDVIVSVGSGESAQEFECYKVVLSFASDYLDAMLSAGMKEEELGKISFPDKDIQKNGSSFTSLSLLKGEGKQKNNAMVNPRNVMTLLPWFHQFQMEEYVHECDECLARRYLSQDYDVFSFRERQDNESDADHQARIDQKKVRFWVIIQVFLMACKYGLESARNTTEIMLSNLIEGHDVSDLFGLSIVENLLGKMLPIQVDADGILSSGGECKILWTAFKKILFPHVSTLSPEVFDNNVHLPLLFHSYMQIHFEKGKARRIKTAAAKIINTIIKRYPERIGYSAHFLSTLKRHYNQEHTEEFKLLGIAPP